jgi:polar amino acid transport system substrate-binding protein
MKNLSGLLFLVFASMAFGQETKKPFRWGTDPSGGAPFVMQGTDGKYTGFEVELAEYLAKKLGRESVMVDGDWARMPEQLNKPADADKGVDVILNGYELSRDKVELYGVSRAYYVFDMLLVSRKDSGISAWRDLDNKQVVVLGGTTSEDHLRKNHSQVDVATNTDVANVFKLVNDGRLPATFQDSPACLYYLKEYPNLHVAAEPVRGGYYVIYFRKDDKDLGAQLDAAIADGLRDGTLRRIYEKYGLWNSKQEELVALLDQPWPPVMSGERADPMPYFVDQLVRAAWMTVKLALISFPLAMVIGLIVAVGRVYGPWFVRVPFGMYVEVIRGTPLLLQLYAIYYMVVPVLLVKIHPDAPLYLGTFVCGVIGLAINYSAYEAENYRAGLLAIPKGQMEAALALGMSRWTAIRVIVIPQAFRLVIPPVTNDFIALFKDTSACSIIMIAELTKRYNDLYNFNRDYIVELVCLTAGLYLLMSYPLALLAKLLEKKLRNA